eukprot:TRINITY_DN9905_c0_g2_i1.p1 TRINITY_DN9905_c0_g2~~TRINITY_DN9905_c0_g2_i1.p1  ORF type:complete len:222 (-),score=31.64 TRINITY_DN9905_c0_g2_i1:310-906(-)
MLQLEDGQASSRSGFSKSEGSEAGALQPVTHGPTRQDEFHVAVPSTESRMAVPGSQTPTSPKTPHTPSAIPKRPDVVQEVNRAGNPGNYEEEDEDDNVFSRWESRIGLAANTAPTHMPQAAPRINVNNMSRPKAKPKPSMWSASRGGPGKSPPKVSLRHLKQASVTPQGVSHSTSRAHTASAAHASTLGHLPENSNGS